MCGVIGMWAPEARPELRSVAMALFRESKIRGLHAFGWYACWPAAENAATYLGGKSHSLGKLAGALARWDEDWPPMLIGHNRYSTSGDWQDHRNNQPITVPGLALVFNGVIHMGLKHEMEEEFNVTLASENDGEVFLRALEATRGHATVKECAEDFVRQITGSFAGVWIDVQTQQICALRNDRRPLWAVVQEEYVAVVSTRDIVSRALGPAAAEAALELPANELFTFERIRDERPSTERGQQSSRLFGIPPGYGDSGRYRSRLPAPPVPG